MPGTPDRTDASPRDSEPRQRPGAKLRDNSESFADIARILLRRRWLFLAVVVGSLLLCLAYCLIAPNQYEAQARVALRADPAPHVSLDAAETAAAPQPVSPLQLETLATVFRSDRLAWRVIAEGKLYQAAGFQGDFATRFSGFRVEAPAADAQAWLLERFQKRLRVQTIPRTLLIQIRFRTRDPVLSATVVNGLIHAYLSQETEGRRQATAQATGWLGSQLKDLKAREEQDRQRLEAFQTEHGILSTPDTVLNGQTSESQHSSTLLEIDELGRQLVAATTDRMQREAEFHAASQGDPELVFAASAGMQAEAVGATALLEQIRARRSELEQEQAQLNIEHGPNFPRTVEIQHQLQDIDRQTKDEDAKLVERFRNAWQTAQSREEMVRKSLDDLNTVGLNQNKAATEYAVMRQEAGASHDVYMRVLGKVEETGLDAGIESSNIAIVDYALQPVKPVTPDLPLYMAITFFVSIWLALGGVLLLETIHPTLPRSNVGGTVVVLIALLAGAAMHAQAPTPRTSGLPGSVTHFPASDETKNQPKPADTPVVWDVPEGVAQNGSAPQGAPMALSAMAGPIGPGDLLDIGEFHTPEFHSLVRVSPAGTVVLPLIKEVKLDGLDEQAAAHAIEAALVAQGMLLHPQVSVLVTLYAGQDVSVLGEVTRPGVYPYTLHHRLLDLISAAAGLAPSAGRLVNIFARNDPKTPHPVVLDPSGTDAGADHNPELMPGDTVQVSRAGLVYVIGDVVRPGGFPVDPAQGLTVVQALSLAWGPSQNAASGKALLIREQKGGRTLTTLNLNHMLHGQEPDQPIRDRDILFVPDSMAKNLWNKSVEAAIQSAIGVSIYSGLVYSQRF